MENIIFKDRVIDFSRLEAFGFEKSGTSYTYRRLVLNEQLEIIVTVTASGQLTAKVFDVELGEEYSVFRSSRASGKFVGQVRAVFQEVLQDIADKCCQARAFASDQANRLAHHLKETYGDHPDYPFESSKTASFRVPANRKWYALLMPLSRQKLDKDAVDEEVAVLNIKVAPEQLSDLLVVDGIYPAYHMSKASWISLVLDGSLSDDFLWELVGNSRGIVAPKGFQVFGQATYWLIPANPKYYDIDAEFAASPEILWTQKAAIKAGDIVWIYMTAPERCLRYACRVLETDLANEGYRDKEDIKYLMRLRLLKAFSNDVMPSSTLSELGIKTVRGPRRATEELYKVLKTILEED